MLSIFILNFNHSNLFFYSDNISESYIKFDWEESMHCIKVLRFSIGDIIIVTDGKGQIANCRIINKHIHSCKLEIISKKYISFTYLDFLECSEKKVLSKTVFLFRCEIFIKFIKLSSLFVSNLSFLYRKNKERSIFIFKNIS